MTTWKNLKQNPELWNRYFIKEYMIKACRKFFENRDYHELESPIITDCLPQERYLDVVDFDLELKNSSKKGYILPTTERFNKIALAAGIGEHFVITKVCRGLEEIGPNHSPEFTMMEWYHLNATYFDLMHDCEELFKSMKNYLDEKFKDKTPTPTWQYGPKLAYQGRIIDINSPWERLSIPAALMKYCNITLEEISTQSQIYNYAKGKGYQVNSDDDWQIIFEMIFALEIEPNFSKDRPTFVYDYPKQLCPLTKENESNPLVCEKVELYLAGKEIANGYTELLDGDEQEKRFLTEQEARKNLGLKPINFDHDLVDALKSGMPDVAGIGMGLDRVAMIFADAKYISDINLFPASEMFGE